jgi:hypothetical protein
MSDLLTTLAGELVKRGAPTLGGLIGSAIGGPAGAAIGGAAGKTLEILGETLGVPPTPEAVGGALSGATDQQIAAAEDAAKVMAPIYMAEANRLAEAQTAELTNGFGAWQFWKAAIQFVVWGGWLVILICALFGGNFGVKSMMPIGELVGVWGSVTMTWMAVYNGGHTVKSLVERGAFNWRGK